MKDPELCDVEEMSLGTSIGSHRGAKGWCDEGNYIVDKKGMYMLYSQVEVYKMGANGMVMHDKEDGKDRMINMEMGKNG
jgi:hypothetical protein